MNTIAQIVLGTRQESLGIRANWFRTIGFTVWTIAVGAGLLMMMQFSFTPGPNTIAPGTWPEESSLPHHAGRAGMLMFAHPKCPCTAASIAQLKQILTELHVPLDCTVVFFVPPMANESWKTSTAIDAARAIPNVNVILDSGVETQRFSALTSGQVLLYETDGRLAYNGGITISRGQIGDNCGTRALIQLLNDKQTTIHQMPAFGCPLFREISSNRNSISCQN